VVVDVAQAPGAPIVAVGQRWDPTGPIDQPLTIAVWTSPDGGSWERAAWPATVDTTWVPIRVAATGGGYLILATPRAGGESALIARSVIGSTWTAIEPPVVFDGGEASDLVAVGDRLVVVGHTLPPDASAPDAAVWIGPTNGH
jgi:hypothetical protein